MGRDRKERPRSVGMRKEGGPRGQREQSTEARMVRTCLRDCSREIQPRKTGVGKSGTPLEKQSYIVAILACYEKTS